MRKTKSIIVALAASVTLILGGGIAWAAGAFTPGTSAATTTEPGVYGACVNVKTKAARFLQVDNLAKSRYGACAQNGSEKFVSLLSGEYKAETKLPASVAYTAGGKHYVCTTAKAVKLRVKLANGKYGKAVSPARYSCAEAVRPVDVPRATPTPTVTPTS